MSVTPAELTGTERAVLLVLMAEARPVPNPELAALGPKLEKSSRDKLNRLGLVDTERIGNRLVHELTDHGWRLCRDIGRDGPPPRTTGAAKALYTVLSALDRYMSRADLSAAEVFWPADTAPGTMTVEDRIRRAYVGLAARTGGWVGLAHLRIELGDIDRPDVDAALVNLYRTPGVSLIPEENQKTLTDSDRAAAVTIGGQAKHLIAIEA